MGVLNLGGGTPPPRNNAGSQLVATALEMLLKRYLDRKDAEAAEAGANTYLRAKEGLPQETTIESPFAPIREDIPRDKPLEKLLTTPAQPSAGEAKKEAPGLPTPPATPLGQLVGVDKEPTSETGTIAEPDRATGEIPNITPAYMKAAPSFERTPKPMVAAGQTQAHYGSRLLQEDAQGTQLAVQYDANGNMTLVPKISGQQLGKKPERESLQYVQPEGQTPFFAPKKLGVVQNPHLDPNAPWQTRNPAKEARLAGAERQAQLRYKMQYDPILQRTRPYSDWEISQVLLHPDADKSELPATPGEAMKVNQIAGRQVAIFNASENAKQAARYAMETQGTPENPGGLNFRDNNITPQLTLTQMAELIARLTHSNDVVDSNLITSYMHGLVNNAMDEATRNYANHLLTLYEAGVAANSLIGGSAQTSDMRYRALLAALPSPVDRRYEDIEGKINRFQTDVALSVGAMPRIKSGFGFTLQQINKDMQEIQMGKPYDQSLIARLAGAAGTTTSVHQTGKPEVTQPTQQAPVTPAPTPAAPTRPGTPPKRIRRFKATGEEY